MKFQKVSVHKQIMSYILVNVVLFAESAMTNTSVTISTATCSPVAVVMLVISGVVLMVTITLNIIISLLCVRCQHRTAPQTSKHELTITSDGLDIDQSIVGSLPHPSESNTADYDNVQLPEVVEMERCLAYGVLKRQ